MNQYGEFAHFYDRMMRDVDYEAWAKYLISFLREANAVHVIDCACGTGVLTVSLAKAGFSMIGIDNSEDMLMEARNSALKNGLRMLPFVCQDMASFVTHRPVDAVISTCDGLNYLLSDDLADGFMKSAYRALKPNGLLLFDISSQYKLSTVLGNETYTDVSDDYAYIWNNAYDPETKLCEMDLTFFVREKEMYRRFSEQHIQRAYDSGTLCRMLEKNGFDTIQVYDAFTREPERNESERIQFVARRK